MNVLIVEDSESDAQLVIKALKPGFSPLHFQRVETANEMMLALSQSKWDVILADYNLPGFSGQRALEIVQEHGIDIPFIMVSGHIGEESAIALMRAGVNNYVMKDNLNKLVPVIHKELNEARIRRERKAALHALQESEARFRQIFEANMIGIAFANTDCEIKCANDAFLNMLGYSKTDFENGEIDWKQLSPEHLQMERLNLLEQLQHSSRPISVEWQYVHRTGTLVDVQLYAALVHGSTDEIIVCATDLTERKEKEAAKLANSRKNNFLVSMSHELRTPLHTIISASTMLAEQVFGGLTAKQAEYISMIHDGGQHLLTIINDILDISKIDAGKMSLHKEAVNIQEFVQEVSALVSPLIEKKQQILRIHLDKSLPEVVAMDKLRLKQVMTNLLSNANKYTPEAKTLQLQCRMDRHQCLIFDVIDEGPGISQEDIERIFHPFEQGSQRRVRRMTGSGLGLALVKRIIELHAGTLHIQSSVGKGSKFTVMIPLASKS